ncbi:MAG TPA: hypothetical protein VK605_02530, partial [Solirubrobacteraceae bacterium]|nr:hypothetical protein [Solirubrobacteraceae bacterium]
LEVMVLESIGKLAFLTKILPNVFKGTHVNQPSVHVFRAREVSISCDRPFTMYADGDPIGELPLSVRAVAGAVTVLVPRRAPASAAFSETPSPLSSDRSAPSARAIADDAAPPSAPPADGR